MKTCKECIHFVVCEKVPTKSADDCDLFKDCARFVELPCNKMNATVESNIYNEEETYYDCTVQVLRNSITGETSVGWFRNDEPPVLIGDD